MNKGDEECYLVGVDVGTGSVRAALVRSCGEVVRVASHPIKTWNPRPEFFQQSSDDIWQSCCIVIKVCTLLKFLINHQSLLKSQLHCYLKN